MVGVQKARERTKQCLEAAYEGTCTVIEHAQVKDETTKLKQRKKVVAAEGLPCRISFETSPAAVQTETAATVSQSIRLFLAPDIAVKPGSEIIVEQNGMRAGYTASGAAAVYPTHQEVMLTLLERWP